MEMQTCPWNVLLKLVHLDLQAQTMTIKMKVGLSAQENLSTRSN